MRHAQMSTAAEIAVEAAETAAEIARTAAEQARLADEVRQQEERDRRLAYRDAAVAYGQRLLADSPLGEWFPGVQWAFYDLPMGREDGQARYVVRPEAGEQFFLVLTRGQRPLGGEHLHETDPDNVAGAPVTVHWATHERDTGTGYLYWSATPVSGPADIGKHLQRGRSDDRDHR